MKIHKASGQLFASTQLICLAKCFRPTEQLQIRPEARQGQFGSEIICQIFSPIFAALSVGQPNGQLEEEQRKQITVANKSQLERVKTIARAQFAAKTWPAANCAPGDNCAPKLVVAHWRSLIRLAAWMAGGRGPTSRRAYRRRRRRSNQAQSRRVLARQLHACAIEREAREREAWRGRAAQENLIELARDFRPPPPQLPALRSTCSFLALARLTCWLVGWLARTSEPARANNFPKPRKSFSLFPSTSLAGSLAGLDGRELGR